MATEKTDITSPQSDKDQASLAKYDLPVDPATVDDAAPAAEEVKPVEPPKHPNWLVRAAKQAGLDDDEVGSMDRAELEKAVDLVSRSQKPVRDPDTGRFVPQPTQPAEPEKEFSLKDFGIDEKRLEMFDPEFAKILTDVVKPLATESKANKKLLAELKERDQQRHTAAATDQLDKLFIQHEKIFGKGEREDLDPESAEYMRRGMVARAMQANFQANPNLSFKKNFEMAAKAFVGLATPTKPAEATVADPKGYRNGAIPKPTNRMEPPKKKGDKAAMDFIKEYQEALTSDEDKEAYEKLPD